MQSDRELMQQALEALEFIGDAAGNNAITALRERLAQPELDTNTITFNGATEMLRLDRKGFHYNGQVIEDAGEAHRLFMQWLAIANAEQPNQSPLDRMAENARKLGLDYEPVQEPVAWQWLDTGTFRKSLPSSAEPGAWNPLYTTPPRREWVGLTEEERALCVQATVDSGDAVQLMCAIEAKLKEKNGRVDSFLRRLLDPEDLGHAVSHEVRQKVRELL